MSRRVLIIGGAGYIGSVVTNHLLARGYHVTSLDLLLYENNMCVLPYSAHPDYRFVYGDMGNRAVMRRALEGATDLVLLAGLVGDPITRKYPDVSRAINDDAVRSCLESANGVGLDRVIFVSTCSNYGFVSNDVIADEQSPLNPLSLYAKSKVAAEQCLLASRGHVDYGATVLRFATAFGLAPRMRFDLTVNEFTRELALGRELLVFDAYTWRPYCHVRDFARLIRLVLEAPRQDVSFQVFNAGGDANNMTKQGIVDIIRRYLPDARVRYQDKGSDPRNYRVNFRKVRDVLGFDVEYSVDAGVCELLAMIREHVFDRADNMRNYHGNYEIHYPQA